jgi:hypothetical protein
MPYFDFQFGGEALWEDVALALADNGSPSRLNGGIGLGVATDVDAEIPDFSYPSTSRCGLNISSLSISVRARTAGSVPCGDCPTATEFTLSDRKAGGSVPKYAALQTEATSALTTAKATVQEPAMWPVSFQRADMVYCRPATCSASGLPLIIPVEGSMDTLAGNAGDIEKRYSTPSDTGMSSRVIVGEKSTSVKAGHNGVRPG